MPFHEYHQGLSTTRTPDNLHELDTSEVSGWLKQESARHSRNAPGSLNPIGIDDYLLVVRRVTELLRNLVRLGSFLHVGRVKRGFYSIAASSSARETVAKLVAESLIA